MLNYLKAELYKTLHRTYTRITLLSFILISVALNLLFLVFYRSGGISSTQEASSISLSVILPLLMPLVYITLIMVDIVFSEEYKYKTFKNTLSYGYTRTQVYLGKLLATLITAAVIYAAMLLVYMISNFILFGFPADLSPLLVLVNRLIAAVPLFMGTIGVCTALAFIIPNSTAFSFVYIGLAMIPYQISYFLMLTNPFWKPLYYAMLPTPFYTLLIGRNPLTSNAGDIVSPFARVNFSDYFLSQPLSAETMIYCIVLGMAYLVIASLIGLFVFKKRDIR